MEKTKNVLEFGRRDIMNKDTEKQCPHYRRIISFDFKICPNCSKKYIKKILDIILIFVKF